MDFWTPFHMHHVNILESTSCWVVFFLSVMICWIASKNQAPISFAALSNRFRSECFGVFPEVGTKNFLLSSWVLWQDLRFQRTYHTLRAKTSIHTYLLFFISIWESSEDKWRPEEAAGLKASVPFYTRNNKLWGCDGTKGLELGAVNCGTANRKCMRETDQGWF